MEDIMAEQCDCIKECVCDKKCPVCGGVKKEVTITNMSFWDLWFQKVLRNFASMKFQWLTILYIPVVYGMFDGKWITLADGTVTWASKVGIKEGLAFLGGGFITLATSRIIARTKLTEPPNGELDTEK
jgi:hypothetical protein